MTFVLFCFVLFVWVFVSEESIFWTVEYILCRRDIYSEFVWHNSYQNKTCVLLCLFCGFSSEIRLFYVYNNSQFWRVPIFCLYDWYNRHEKKSIPNSDRTSIFSHEWLSLFRHQTTLGNDCYTVFTRSLFRDIKKDVH